MGDATDAHALSGEHGRAQGGHHEAGQVQPAADCRFRHCADRPDRRRSRCGLRVPRNPDGNVMIQRITVWMNLPVWASALPAPNRQYTTVPVSKFGRLPRSISIE